ncbi:MAG: hypothetical protein R3248_11100 [Candidatus Promineifilaceae bacterium]|nr:hypothetical protein [Candidatus Promineifilaceae bacterium]
MLTDFPTLFDWIERLSFLRGLPAAYIVLLTGLIIAVVWDWRLSLMALMVQYVVATLLFVDVLEPRLAIVKLFVGLFVCLILYFAARQASASQSPEPRTTGKWDERAGRPQRTTLAFRTFLALAVALTALALSGRAGYRLPAVPSHVNLAIYGLVGMGLLLLALTTRPLTAGMGLLMIMTGFELFYNTLEQSTTMLILLAGANLILALTVSYLAQLSSSRPPTITAPWPKR